MSHEQGQRGHGRQNPFDGMRRTQRTFASTNFPDTQLASLTLRPCERGSLQPQGNGFDAQGPEDTSRRRNLRLSSSEVERRFGCKTITMCDAQKNRPLGARRPRELENPELYNLTIILREAVTETMHAKFGRLPRNLTIMRDADYAAAQDRGPAYVQDLFSCSSILQSREI